MNAGMVIPEKNDKSTPTRESEIELTVNDPTANAIMSVKEVTVMETPACFSVYAIFSSSGSFFSSSDNSCQQATKTNISSTPKKIDFVK